MSQYSDFAFIYDELMNDVDYDKWVLYIEEIIKKKGVKVKNILELACGTGNLTIPLTLKNYDIAGIDISEDMLNIAREKATEQGVELVLLQQNIAELDFEVENLDCVLCACDGFNYLTYDDEIENCFSRVYDILKKDGIFIFDISSYYKLSNTLGNNTFAEKRENIVYIWQNYFDDTESLIDMELTFFIKDKSGKYDKFTEVHQQRAYTEKEILNFLKKSGFNNIEVLSDFKMEAPKEKSERLFFVCKK